MERARATRKSHTNTSDLLTWSEAPQSTPLPTVPSPRSHQPSDGIRKVVFGGQVTDEETQSFQKTKPCSGYKMKEMTGSGIFAAEDEDDDPDSGVNSQKTGVRIFQQAANGISQISFSTEESITSKKPTSIPEVAKQRELSGTLESESDLTGKKHVSDAKSKELSGTDIFGPPPENPSRSLAIDQTMGSKERKPAGGQSNILFGEEPEVETTKKIHNQKFQELTGNDIFKGDAPSGSVEKSLSHSKLKEMSGSNIFADEGNSEARCYYGGVRKPPGGESSISLV